MLNLSARVAFSLIFILNVETCKKIQETYTDVETEPSFPSKSELMQAMREQGKLLVVYEGKTEQSRERFRTVLEKIQQQSRRIAIILKHADEIVETDLEQYPLWLIGYANPVYRFQAISYQSPLKLEDQAFHIQDVVYQSRFDILSLSMLPNPWNLKLPCSLLKGNDDEQLLDYLENMSQDNRGGPMFRGWDFEVFSQRKRVSMGDFKRKSGAYWEIDPEAYWDFHDAGKLVRSEKGINWYSYTQTINETRFSVWQHRYEGAAQRLGAILGKDSLAMPTHSLFLYPSVEYKGLRTQQTLPIHTDLENNVLHVVLNAEYDGFEQGDEYRLLIQNALGKSAAPSLSRGLEVLLCQNWQGRGWAYWAARLAEAGNLPSVKRIMEGDHGSQLILACASGAFSSMILQKKGGNAFQRYYSEEGLLAQELPAWEKEWQAYQKELIRAYPSTPLDIQAPTGKVLKGFNFTHEGYRIYDGYTSGKAGKSLQHIAGIGGNAVTIVPYTFQPDPKRPNRFEIPERAGSENDEGVIHTLIAAQDAGLTVMVKPQIWVGRGWPGDIQMQTPEDWKAFFHHYEEWIAHYALLSAIRGADLLCIGTELAKTTVVQEQAWRGMIRNVRKIYPGTIVYAANWGEEFEQLKFWDELDYVSFDCYYPLSNKEAPTDAEMKKGFQDVIRKIEQTTQKYNKPFMFTEIGFRSVERPWMNPHAETQGRALNNEHQARCYAIVTEELRNKPWLKGIFWWKWPTYLEYSERNRDCFTPLDKPSEKILSEWFKSI